MAGHFPLPLRQALQQGHFDMERVTRWATLSHAPAVALDVDLAPHVDKWGSVTFSLVNHDIRSRDSIAFPELSIELKNESGFFTPGRFPTAWQGYPPQEFIYTFGATYDVDGTDYELVPHAEWSIVKVTHAGDRATVTMAHRLSRYWAKRFGAADKYRGETAEAWG